MMRRFDYSFLKNDIPAQIVGISNVITDLNAREKFRKLQNEKTFEAMRRKAMVASVKGSNAIEGILTTDSRIRDIVEGAIPISHDEKEISGYRDALSVIHEQYDNLDLSEEFILEIHRMLFDAVSPDEAGHYKKNNNLILEFDADGGRRVRFYPMDAKDTPEAMKQMIFAYMDARQDAEISSMLLIPCVILDFLCIHPFTDDNGRISRLLTIFLLYKHGYDIGRYISVEAQINEYKEAYYRALEESSSGWIENQNDYVPFIIYSLQILYRCYKLLDGGFTEIALKKAKKSERVEAVVMNALVPISKAEIAEKLPDVSIKTVESVLNKLQKNGKIQKIGSYRNARYMKRRTT